MSEPEQKIEEFDVWENEVPVILFKEDSEFDVWENEVPIMNQRKEDAVPVIIKRRRYFEF